ncbi:CurL C-terminal domain-containing protein [Streptomyces sp. NPDC004561]
MPSAHTPTALRQQAARLAAHVAARPELDPQDVAFTLSAGRSAFPHRATATGADRSALPHG